jgi:hypothetical protein
VRESGRWVFENHLFFFFLCLVFLLLVATAAAAVVLFCSWGCELCKGMRGGWLRISGFLVLLTDF